MDAEHAFKARPRRELVMRVLDPPAGLLVRVLAPRGVDPLWLVASHGACGLAAAGLVAFGGAPAWPWAAAALLLRAVLDNADGALARATGRITRLGRYADTGTDLIVHTALFAALAVPAGPLPAAAAFVALVAILSVDHNLERLYRVPRTPHGEAAADDPAPRPAPGPALRFFEGLYERVLAPQDRLIERWDRAAFERLEGAPYDAAPLDRRLAWSDLFSVATVTDLGLSTQTVLLAALLAVGRPEAYPPLVLVMAAWVAVAQGLRVARYRAYRRAEPEEHRAGP